MIRPEMAMTKLTIASDVPVFCWEVQHAQLEHEVVAVVEELAAMLDASGKDNCLLMLVFSSCYIWIGEKRYKPPQEGGRCVM
jgi:hypothetical protein